MGACCLGASVVGILRVFDVDDVDVGDEAGGWNGSKFGDVFCSSNLEKSKEVRMLTAAKCHDNKPRPRELVGALPDTHLARARLLVGWGSEAGRSGVQLFTLSSAAPPEWGWWLRTPHRTEGPTLQAACLGGHQPEKVLQPRRVACLTLSDIDVRVQGLSGLQPTKVHC